MVFIEDMEVMGTIVISLNFSATDYNECGKLLAAAEAQLLTSHAPTSP
jgi:hypothetical protein